jgi:hypothetical protein
MARVVLAANDKIREVFVIDYAVGAGCPNRKDDVFLVQFLLRVATLDGGGKLGYKPPNEAPIQIDGIYGGQTQRYISFFQKELDRRNNGKLAEPDGRIDPPRGKRTSSITQTGYTVLWLNNVYRQRRGETFPIETDPLFPAALLDSLFE